MKNNGQKRRWVRAYYVFTAIVFLLFCAGYFLLLVFGHGDQRIYKEDLRHARHKWRIHIVKDVGWQETPQGLAVRKDEVAERVYQFYKDDEQHVFLNLWFRSHPDVHSRLVIQKEKEVHITENPNFNGGGLDITPMTKGFGPFNIHVAAEVKSGSRVSEVPLFSGLIVKIFSPHSLRWGPLLFFFATSVFVYGIVFFILVPEILSVRLSLLNRRSVVYPWSLFFIIAFVLLGAWYGTKRCWYVQKKFDDEMAISNASVLLDKRFDTSYMFFRSRTRPGFISFVQPIVALFPNIQITTSQFPSDFRRRVWHLYDRDSNTYYGDVVYPEVSAAALVIGLLVFFLIYRILRELGVERTQSYVAVLLSIFFYRNSLGVCITQTYNLFINLVAVYLYLRVFRSKRSVGMVVLSAGALSLAALTKTTVVTSIVPIFFHQVYSVWRERGSGELIKRIVLYWLVVLILPVIWFEWIMGGFVKEYVEFWQDHLKTQSLNEYPPTSFGLSVKYLFEVFSVFLVPAVLGFILALAGKWREEEKNYFFIMWALGCSLTFALPYIFPRFLKYFIPSFAYFSVLGFAWVLSRFRKQSTAT